MAPRLWAVVVLALLLPRDVAHSHSLAALSSPFQPAGPMLSTMAGQQGSSPAVTGWQGVACSFCLGRRATHGVPSDDQGGLWSVVMCSECVGTMSGAGAIFLRYRCVECKRHASFGPSEGRPRDVLHCKLHRKEGEVDLVHSRCAHEGCVTSPSYGSASDGRRVYCLLHKESDHVQVKKCPHHHGYKAMCSECGHGPWLEGEGETEQRPIRAYRRRSTASPGSSPGSGRDESKVITTRRNSEAYYYRHREKVLARRKARKEMRSNEGGDAAAAAAAAASIQGLDVTGEGGAVTGGLAAAEGGKGEEGGGGGGAGAGGGRLLGRQGYVDCGECGCYHHVSQHCGSNAQVQRRNASPPGGRQGFSSCSSCGVYHHAQQVCGTRTPSPPLTLPSSTCTAISKHRVAERRTGSPQMTARRRERGRSGTRRWGNQYGRGILTESAPTLMAQDDGVRMKELQLEPLANPALGRCKLKRAISVSPSPLCDVASSPSIYSSISDEDNNNGALQQPVAGSNGLNSHVDLHRTLSPCDASGVSGESASLNCGVESGSINGGMGLLEGAWGVRHASPLDESAPMNGVNAFYPC